MGLLTWELIWLLREPLDRSGYHEALPFPLHGIPVDLSRHPCVPLCVGAESTHNWHCRWLRLPQLRECGLEAALPVIGYIPPVLLGEFVALRIPPGLCPRFLPDYFWTLGSTCRWSSRTCLIPRPVWTHLVPVGVGVFPALLPVVGPGPTGVLYLGTWNSGILRFAG